MKTASQPPRVEGLRIRNYRALRDVAFDKLAPLTTLLGPNGSGKSTVFDAFAFLAECFSIGLRKAWDRRGRFKELRSRGQDGPIVFELKFREPGEPLMTYYLEINERQKSPYVATEWIRWKRHSYGYPYKFLNFHEGEGYAITGQAPIKDDTRRYEKLDSPEFLAVNTLGQFKDFAPVAALRRFITGWHLSYLTADTTRVLPEAGPQEHLTQTGDNLPNVIQYLKEQHSERLEHIFTVMRQRIPRLESVKATELDDGRLLLQLKDAPFERPILYKYISDGTLKMLAYLVTLYDPTPPPLIGIEEPENHLHPRLLPELAEECRVAAERSQLIVTTHSPFFVNALRPEEVWVIYRNREGYTETRRAADIQGVQEFMSAGATLGRLWMEGYLGGDPLTRSGEPLAVSTRQVE